MNINYVKENMFLSAYFELKGDDITGDLYWSGYAEGDKDGSNFNYGDPLVLSPEHFPLGCKVHLYEPFIEEVKDDKSICS